MRNENGTQLTKKAFAAMAGYALASALLLKLFSDLAFAGEIPTSKAPSFAPPAQVLGTYEVTRSIPNHASGQRVADEMIGKRVYVLRSGRQVALIRASEVRGSAQYLDVGILLTSRKDCDAAIPLEEARERLFSSRFCRATRDPRLGTRDTEAFRYGRADPRVVAISRSTGRLASGGLGAATASTYVIRLPRQETVPARIEIEEESVTAFMGIPVRVRLQHSLTRIGD